MNIEDIELNKDNKSKIAIVCVGYNRLRSMQRLLSSLLNSEYPIKDIPLVISIDCSGDTGLYDYVLGFEWPFGQKYVIIQKVRLGLKNHIYQCGDLTRYFNAVIILEDDIFVSPYFYRYSLACVGKYDSEEDVCGIALYSPKNNGYASLPFNPLNVGTSVYMLQDVCTWGECFTERMWTDFKLWLETSSEDDILMADMPVQIKKWNRAWSKYFYAYMISTGKYFITPYVSYSTNFSDAGEHGYDTNSVQVPMMWGSDNFTLNNVFQLEKYDAYYSNIRLYEHLKMTSNTLCIDLYGMGRNILGKKYILTSKALPFKVIYQYALSCHPIEANVLNNISGKGIFLYDSSISEVKPSGYSRNKILDFYFCSFNHKDLFIYALLALKRIYKRKLLKLISLCFRR